MNNGSEGIDCDAEPPVPWVHGKEIMKFMRNVSQGQQQHRNHKKIIIFCRNNDLSHNSKGGNDTLC